MLSCKLSLTGRRHKHKGLWYDLLIFIPCGNVYRYIGFLSWLAGKTIRFVIKLIDNDLYDTIGIRKLVLMLLLSYLLAWHCQHLLWRMVLLHLLAKVTTFQNTIVMLAIIQRLIVIHSLPSKQSNSFIFMFIFLTCVVISFLSCLILGLIHKYTL